MLTRRRERLIDWWFAPKTRTSWRRVGGPCDVIRLSLT